MPTIALDNGPMWDLNLGVWTEEAITAGYRSRVIDEFQILGLTSQGHITGMDGRTYGSPRGRRSNGYRRRVATGNNTSVAARSPS